MHIITLFIHVGPKQNENIHFVFIHLGQTWKSGRSYTPNITCTIHYSFQEYSLEMPTLVILNYSLEMPALFTYILTYHTDTKI